MPRTDGRTSAARMGELRHHEGRLPPGAVEAPTVPDMMTTTPTPVSDAPDSAARGNMATVMESFLSSFGVVNVEQRDEVSEAIDAELAARGHQAELQALRYGTAYLGASVQAARFLRYDLRNILLALQNRVPGMVEHLVVRVER